MIEKSQPLSAVEATEFIKEKTEIKSFIKKFTKTNPETAKELRAAVEALDLIKVRADHISKIIDTMPETREELTKIFVDVTLDENESTKILDTIKNIK